MGDLENISSWSYWLWLVNTNCGDIFVNVHGPWTQPEGAKLVWSLFSVLAHRYRVELDIIGMVQRKRYTSGIDNSVTITILDSTIHILAGKRLWEICGRTLEHETEMILFEEELKQNDTLRKLLERIE